MPQFTAEELKNKSPEELAILNERNDPLSSEGILIKDEWQRRARIEQHALDIKLMSKQVRSMRFAAILGVIATLVGAILGAYLQYCLSQRQSRSSPAVVQQEDRRSLETGHNPNGVPPYSSKEKAISPKLKSPSKGRSND